MSEQQDDQIIAVAFRRSVYVILALLLILFLAWGLSGLFDGQDSDQVTNNAIGPQSIDRRDEPTPPKVMFTDITQQSGINHEHINGAYGERLLPETMGGGVAVLDFNEDQNVDLLFINGTSWPWQDDTLQQSSLLLYQGDGTGNFVRIEREVFPDSSIYGMGAAVADYDNDGDGDIFVTAVGENRLYRNLGDGSFEEVSKSAGVRGDDDAWSTGATFIDFDKDGDLDLFVLNYLRWSREIDLQADYRLTGIGRAYGPPAQFAGTNSYLYRNDGDGSFTDVSAEFGIHVEHASTGQPIGKGLAVLPADIDKDGWTDLVVANDTVRNFLFLNREGSGFEELGEFTGIAFDNTGSATGAMGIDGTTFPDTSEYAIAIGNFGNEMTSLYVQPNGQTLFTDQAIVTGVGPASRRAVTFGLFFFDYDLDGRDDLLQVNGHIEPEINIVEPSLSYAQSAQLFWNCGLTCARQFVPISLSKDNALQSPIVGRGAAYADIDKDGDQDLILTQIGAAPKLLRNDQTIANNWLKVEVLNKFGAPAVGSKVSIESDGQTITKVLQPTRSYLSQMEAVVTFGLPSDTQVERLSVQGPYGETVSQPAPELNKRHVLQLSN